MANRPSNSRLINVINWGIDKRIPLGFVDTVIDKETGNLIGFMQDGEFYELGAKPKKKPKAPEMPEVSGLTAADINFGIPGGGVDPRRAAAYLDSSDPRLSEAAQKIILAQTAGLMDLDGNVAETAISRNDEAARLQSAADQKFTEKIKQETLDKKKNANQEAMQGGYQVPYPDIEKSTKPTAKATAPVTGGNTGIPTTKIQPTYTGERQSAAASAAALGLPASDLTRPSTVAETFAKDTTEKNGQTPPKVPGKDKKTPGLTDAQERDQALAAAAANADFSLPETLFNNVDELTQLLDDYVKSDKNGGQWTLDTFRQKFRNTNWYKNNSAEIKSRYVQLYNYRDQLKGGQDVSNTEYAKQISTLERKIADKARIIGSGIASDPDALRRAAENFYITNVGIDDAMATDFIAAAIRPIGGTIGGKPTSGYSGKALQDYQTIQASARANGFKVSDIIPGGFNEQQVLEGLATGRLDINRLEQDARKLAAQGQPQYVRDLLGQGYNLDQVYAPYRTTMANLLELNADQIDLNDPTLRMAITDKGDMNVYDFKKALKADNRWQYTENAKNEVSTAAFNVLRDFGFQG
jgi:hypothetical protein